jgi:hypothetical protein
MIYVNLKTSTLRSPAYVGAEPVQRATWLSLLAYCCEQENDGIIDGAEAWKDRQWQQTCGVTLAEVQDACDLWAWSGDALVVTFFPREKQEEVQRNREAGRRGGSRRTKAKIEAARVNGAKHNPSTNPSTNPSGTQALTQAEPKQEPNGKERKGIGIGKEGTDTPSLAQFIEQCRRAGVEKELAEEIWHDNDGRPITPDGEWTDHTGQPIRNPISNAISRAAAMRRRRGGGAPMLTNGRKPPTPWELKQSIEAAEKEAERMANDPRNKAYDPAAFRSVLLPEAKARIATLRTRAAEMRQQMAGIEGAAV